MEKEILEGAVETETTAQEVTQQDTNGAASTLDGAQYIQAIKQLKANSVPTTEYEKLKAENAQLVQAMLDGQTIAPDQEPARPNVQELRKELYDSDASMSNLEYIEKTLDLRDAIINEGGRDPFLPWGKNIAPDEDDIRAANRTASILKECIEYANGDSELFTNELQRRTIDSAPNIHSKGRR